MLRVNNYRRRTTGLPGPALILCILLSLPVSSTESREPAKTPVSEQVLSELRAANRIRAQLMTENQAWEMEKQRLKLLKSTITGETARIKSVTAENRKKEAELRKRMTVDEKRQQRLKQIEAMLDAIAERLEQALDALSARSLPGLVPPDTAADITDPARRLNATASRLDQARQRSRTSSVELVVGHLDEKSSTVRMIRAGGIGAWWMSLDGGAGGTATIRDGKLVLKKIDTKEGMNEIRKAFSILEGRAAPDWIMLPAKQIKPENK